MNIRISGIALAAIFFFSFAYAEEFQFSRPGVPGYSEDLYAKTISVNEVDLVKVSRQLEDLCESESIKEGFQKDDQLINAWIDIVTVSTDKTVAVCYTTRER